MRRVCSVGYVDRVLPGGVVGCAQVRVGNRALRAYAVTPFPPGHEQVGGIFGDIANVVKKVTKSKAFQTVANIAADVIPGGGIVKGAIDAATGLLGGGAGGGAAPAPAAVPPTTVVPAVAAPQAPQLPAWQASLMHRATSPGALKTLARSGYGQPPRPTDLRYARWYVAQLPPHERVPAIKQLLGLHL